MCPRTSAVYPLFLLASLTRSLFAFYLIIRQFDPETNCLVSILICVCVALVFSCFDSCRLSACMTSPHLLSTCIMKEDQTRHGNTSEASLPTGEATFVQHQLADHHLGLHQFGPMPWRSSYPSLQPTATPPSSAPMLPTQPWPSQPYTLLVEQDAVGPTGCHDSILCSFAECPRITNVQRILLVILQLTGQAQVWVETSAYAVIDCFHPSRSGAVSSNYLLRLHQ